MFAVAEFELLLQLMYVATITSMHKSAPSISYTSKLFEEVQGLVEEDLPHAGSSFLGSFTCFVMTCDILCL